jgi:hypothetical protein
MPLRIIRVLQIVGAVAAAVLASPAHQSAADPVSDAMAGTYQATFDNGNTQTWDIRSGCTAMLATCVTVTRPDGVGIAEMADGRWNFHVYADPSANTQTVYSWDPSGLSGTMLKVIKGPCNYRACDYRNEPAGSFTLKRTG